MRIATADVGGTDDGAPVPPQETALGFSGASRSRGGLGGGLAAIGVCTLLALLGAAPAGAAPTWLVPTALSSIGTNAESPQVAVDTQGDALSVWQNTATRLIEASSRPAGGSAWGAPVVLSSASAQASVPQVAVDGQGDAVAAWVSLEGGEYSIVAVTRPGLDGAWSAPVTLRKLGTEAATELRPDLAVNTQGDAVAVWQRLKGPSEVSIEAASRPAGGLWQSPVTLSETGDPMHPAEVGIDSAGNATAVWEAKVAGDILIDAASRPAGGAWSFPVALSAPGHNANEPRVAVDAKGDTVAVWERFNSEEIIEAASRPGPGGAWGEAVALTKKEGGKGEPGNQQVAVGGNGDAVVVWGRLNGTHETIEAAEGHVATSVWLAPIAVSGPGRTIEEAPRVAVNGLGGAVAIWERWDGAENIVEAASGLAASGSWQAPVALSSAGAEAIKPQVALDAGGDAAAVWQRLSGTYRVEAAGFDAAGPLLESLSIPASGTAGQALALSVSPRDVWSALGVTSWSFGDGTSGVGTSITHAYAAAGIYSVTVTSADALGNATSATGTLNVGPSTTLISKQLPPRITGARLTHARFRVSKRPTAVSARSRAPLGTSFKFSLTESAKVQIVFTRSAAGLRGAGRCLAPTARLRRRHARSCTRTLVVGRLTRAQEPAGPGAIAFSGRIGNAPLAPGAYRALLTASAGGLRSTPVSLSLTVVR